MDGALARDTRLGPQGGGLWLVEKDENWVKLAIHHLVGVCSL
jgi:hypothetical protein